MSPWFYVLEAERNFRYKEAHSQHGVTAGHNRVREIAATRHFQFIPRRAFRPLQWTPHDSRDTTVRTVVVEIGHRGETCFNSISLHHGEFQGAEETHVDTGEPLDSCYS